MGFTKTPPNKAQSFITPINSCACYLEIYFCDPATDFIMFNNEYIPKAGQNSIYKGVQGMQDPYREGVNEIL